MSDPKPPTRKQLARILDNDQELIRAFERLFSVAAEQIPTDITSIELSSGTADQKATQALDLLYSINEYLSLLASRPGYTHPNTVPLDSIEFNLNQKTHQKRGSLAYNSLHDTLEILHDKDVHQEIGLNTYVHVENYTSSTITAGTVVGFAGVGTDEHISVAKYLADGASDSIYLLGVMTADIATGGDHAMCITWGHVHGIDTTGTPVSETWVVGDVLYASPTTAGAMTKVKPTAPENSIPVAVLLDVDATDGVIFIRPTIEQQYYFGGFYKSVDASPAAINTAYPITFDGTEVSNGVEIDGTVTSRININNAGLYSVGVSFQLSSGSASAKNVWLWFRINGADVANSALKVSLESNTALSTPARAVFFSFEAGDYFELIWAADDTNVTLDAIPSTAFAPAAPACVLTVEQIQQ